MHRIISTNRVIAASTIFALLVVSFLSQIYDFDIWYHMSIGREVWVNWAIPTHEFLVYPNQQDPVTLHEWGFGVLTYLVKSSSGAIGLSLLNALLLSAALIFLFNASSDQTASFASRLLALGIVMFGISHTRYFRPELILFVTLSIEIFLLERFLSTANQKFLVPIPVLGFVLSQAHPSAIFLLFFLFCAGLQAAWWNRNDRPGLKRTLAITGGYAIATFLLSSANPYGIGQVLEPLFFAGQEEILSRVTEFKSTLQSPERQKFIFFSFASAACLLFDRKRLLFNGFVIAAFGYIALRYQRNISLFALVLFVPVSRTLEQIFVATRSRLTRNSQFGGNHTWRLAWAFVAWFVFALAVNEKAQFPAWGIGVAPDRFPETSARIINQVQPPGNVFNFYDYGGYFGWALHGQYDVFIDGRNNRPSRALTDHNAIVMARTGWDNALRFYNVNTIAIPTLMLTSGGLLPVIEELDRNPEWTLAYAGKRELLFFRETVVEEAAELQLLDQSSLWLQVFSDAQDHIAKNASTRHAYYALATSAMHLGYKSAAIQAYQQYLSLVPNDLKAATRLRQLAEES